MHVDVTHENRCSRCVEKQWHFTHVLKVSNEPLVTSNIYLPKSGVMLMTKSTLQNFMTIGLGIIFYGCLKMPDSYSTIGDHYSIAKLALPCSRDSRLQTDSQLEQQHGSSNIAYCHYYYSYLVTIVRSSFLITLSHLSLTSRLQNNN